MHIGIFTSLAILTIFALFEQYAAMLVSLLLVAFYIIVVESGKFPRLQNFVNDAF